MADLTQAQIDRYNLGKQFYADHLSFATLLATVGSTTSGLAATPEYIGFTDAAIAGWLDAVANDIRTLKDNMTVKRY